MMPSSPSTSPTNHHALLSSSSTCPMIWMSNPTKCVWSLMCSAHAHHSLVPCGLCCTHSCTDCAHWPSDMAMVTSVLCDDMSSGMSSDMTQPPRSQTCQHTSCTWWHQTWNQSCWCMREWREQSHECWCQMRIFDSCELVMNLLATMMMPSRATHWSKCNSKLMNWLMSSKLKQNWIHNSAWKMMN